MNESLIMFKNRLMEGNNKTNKQFIVTKIRQPIFLIQKGNRFTGFQKNS